MSCLENQIWTSTEEERDKIFTKKLSFSFFSHLEKEIAKHMNVA